MSVDAESNTGALQDQIRTALKRVTDRGTNLSVDQQIHLSSSEVQGVSAIALARSLDSLKTDMQAAAIRLEQKLDQHAGVLSQAAESSDRHADKIARATWALAVLTAILAIATIVMAVQAVKP